MFVPQPALTAFRHDNARLPHVPHVEGLLAGALVFASLLESSLTQVAAPHVGRGGEPHRQLHVAEHEAHLRAIAREHGILGGDLVESPHLTDGAGTLATLSELSRRVAERTEQAGALHLANSVLWALERVGELLPPIEHGRVLAHRARVARKANAHDVALTLYKHVAALGRRLDSGELRARAALGFGVLAQFRGHLPLAARHFRTAAREAKRVGATDVLRVAQHGQLTIAAKRGAFSDALVFGWHAYQDAWGNREAEAEMLLNLAQLAFDVGRADAALAGFTAALVRQPGPRLALPALGGAGRAAAALGRVELLRHYAREVDAYRGDEGFAYPVASALLDLALAFASCDRVAACDRVNAGLALAAKYRFHELDFQLHDLARELAKGRSGKAYAGPIHVAPRGETVLQSLSGEAAALDADRRRSRRLAARLV